MPDPLTELLDQKAAILREFSQLGDFRPGSISTTTGRCGNPRCHCHQPGAPGHGPRARLTYKAQGKTITESFPSPAARQKTEREVAEYRRWQQLSSEFVETNASICRVRPVEEPEPSEQEKKRSKRSTRRSRAK